MTLDELLKIRKPSTYTTSELKIVRDWTERELSSGRLTEAELETVTEWKALLDAEDADREKAAAEIKASGIKHGLDRQ